MFRRINQIVDVVEIKLCVVKLLGRSRFEEASGDFIALAVEVVLFPRACASHGPHVSKALSVGSPGHVILDVGIPFIS